MEMDQLNRIVTSNSKLSYIVAATRWDEMKLESDASMVVKQPTLH